MVRTFAQAVDYVNLNQEDWSRMINCCFDEWAKEKATLDYPFEQYIFETYGIKIDRLEFDQRNFYVVDSRKYMLFQLKFTA